MLLTENENKQQKQMMEKWTVIPLAELIPASLIIVLVYFFWIRLICWSSWGCYKFGIYSTFIFFYLMSGNVCTYFYLRLCTRKIPHVHICVDSVSISDSEREDIEPISNSVRILCIHFHTNNMEKNMLKYRFSCNLRFK